ncbi:MAG: hypothetical protein R3C59_30890 [Planctomycetaceae bacterium]
MPEFSASATLPCSADRLREFLGLTANLPAISDPELELEVLSAPEIITLDGVIEFRITAYGFKQRMQHRYVEVSERQIVAVQIDGPTRSWLHRQTIQENEDGTCTLVDHIEFEPPGGMLGYLMTADRITESLTDGMEFRYSSLARELG